jgi:TolB-like protein/class 3 adenylate cyclase
MQDRRLSAIMFTDIVGYTTLMGEDEDKAFDLLQKNADLHRSIIAQHRGDFIKEIGDGILISFSTNAAAVRCAIDLQKASRKLGYKLRIGVHEGDLVFQKGDVWGDGVNIASRLQEIASPGKILVSGAVNKDIKNKADISTKYLSKKTFKNVVEPIKVYQVIIENDNTNSTPSVIAGSKKFELTRFHYLIIGFAIILIGVIIWYNLPEKGHTDLEKTIAVLPFKNLSNNPAEQYLADGVMDAIINHLQKIKDLEVRSRTSVEQFRDPDLSLPEISDKLNVNYIIEGSFQKAGDEANLVVQLIVADEDRHLWAEDYTRNWSDIFIVQSEVAQSIATELEMILTQGEQEMISRRPTNNLTAYDYYLRGQENNVRYFFSHNEEDFQNAINLFRHALALDPNFTQVYIEMSWTFWWRNFWGEQSTQFNYLDSAIVLSEHALNLDPNLPDGYTLRGLFYMVRGNREKASEFLNRGRELKPNDPRVYRFLGLLNHNKRNYKESIKNYLIAENLEHTNYEILILKMKMVEMFLEIGDFEYAGSYIQDLLDLEPNFSGALLLAGWHALLNGNFEKTVHLYKKGLDESRFTPYVLKSIGEVLAYSGQYSESREYWLHAKDLTGEQEMDVDVSNFRYAYTLWMLGEEEKAKRMFEKFTVYCKNYINGDSFYKNSGTYYFLAGTYAFLGETEEALKWLREQEREGFTIQTRYGVWFSCDYFMNYDPLFDNIRDEAEFHEILDRALTKKAKIRAEVKEIIRSGNI